MITNSILLVFQGLISVLLSPLTIINFTVDILANITAVQQFLQIAAYILPWSRLTPLFIFVVGVFIFRILMSLVKLVLDFIPFE